MSSDYTKIYSGNIVNVTYILSKLEADGIVAVVKDESESGRLAGFGASLQNFQEVHVHRDELDRSVAIVEAALAELKS